MQKKTFKIEVPFNERHCCWFCGEPYHSDLIFPVEYNNKDNTNASIFIEKCPHPTLIVQTCHECKKFASGANAPHIWAVRRFVKSKLIKTYTKHLAIGVNWTQEELANSDFEQGNFAGFARSAWFMFEVAKGRVNYESWPLVIDGIELNELDFSTQAIENFSFDGVVYPSVSEAVKYYCNVFYIDESYFYKVLRCMVSESSDVNQTLFAKTVRFCRLLVNESSHECKLALQGLAINNSMGH